MKLSARILLAIRNFFKKYWGIIVAVLVIWVGLFIFNMYLKNRPKKIELSNTYDPDTPVLDNKEKVPAKEREEVNTLIDTFFNYCNNKEYANAYNMLTEDCKSYLYSNSVGQFKNYVDEIYNTKKIYNIQNYSNTDDAYIYNIRILDDIMSTGTTGGYEPYQEKIVIIEENGTKKITNQGYMGKHIFKNAVGEDEYLKVKIISKNMSYTREEYYVEITNKTDGYISVGNGATANEITINLGDQKRNALDIINNNVFLKPGNTNTYHFIFDKYYDDGKDPTELNLNLVRVYDNNEEKALAGKSSDALKAYSMNIPLNNK